MQSRFTTQAKKRRSVWRATGEQKKRLGSFRNAPSVKAEYMFLFCICQPPVGVVNGAASKSTVSHCQAPRHTRRESRSGGEGNNKVYFLSCMSLLSSVKTPGMELKFVKIPSSFHVEMKSLAPLVGKSLQQAAAEAVEQWNEKTRTAVQTKPAAKKAK